MKLSPLLVAVFSLSLAAQGEELRVFTSSKGTKLKASVESVTAGQATIVREDGQKLTLPLTAFSAEDQLFLKQRAATPKFNGKNDKLSAEEVNAVIGQPLFAEESLWATDAAVVAERLKLKEESKTKEQSSYRSYTKDDFNMFGAHPYSVALYADKDKVTSLSLVFANKGDLFSAKGAGEKHFDKDTPPAQAAKMVRDAMNTDLKAITSALTAKLGEPKKERFGDGKAARMNMQRWDWRGHAILLADAEDEKKKEPEYVGVQIVTTAFADAGGKTGHVPDAVVRAHAKENIDSRASGDVVISDIPMVDQGPKGYCVPATMERAMRFMGMSADMYVLANAGNSGFGGGTSVEVLLENIGHTIRAKSRSFDSWGGEMKFKDITKHIDKGIPIVWALYSTKEFNNTANARTKERQLVTDWAEWKSKVSSESASNHLTKDRETSHVVLIIGYNKTTNEIAFSDSWGERYKERWITLSEAEQVSQKRFYVVGF